MTNQHPISVPQELLNQWCRWKPGQTPEGLWREIADNAAQWVSDQELEACCEWLVSKLTFREDGIRFADELRAARRPSPKPPSEAEQALAALEADPKDGAMIMIDSEQFSIIRRALQRLKEMESAND